MPYTKIHMTAPDGDCFLHSSSGGRVRNTIYLTWETARATDTHASLGALCEAYTAQERAFWGPLAAPSPTRLRGTLTGIDVLGQRTLGTPANSRPKTNYKIYIRKGDPKGPDICAGSLKNLYGATDRRTWQPKSPIPIENDLYIYVKDCANATSSTKKSAGLLLFLE